MASSSSSQAILKAIKSPTMQRSCEVVRQKVFGHLPQLNLDRGHKTAKKAFTGPYIARYYPESINGYARKVMPGWETEQEEYRRVKRINRRRKGKGAPPKGGGARASKK